MWSNPIDTIGQYHVCTDHIHAMIKKQNLAQKLISNETVYLMKESHLYLRSCWQTYTRSKINIGWCYCRGNIQYLHSGDSPLLPFRQHILCLLMCFFKYQYYILQLTTCTFTTTQSCAWRALENKEILICMHVNWSSVQTTESICIKVSQLTSVECVCKVG